MSRKSYEVAAITEDDGPASSYAVPMIISIHNRISDRRVAVQRHKEGHANKYIQPTRRDVRAPDVWFGTSFAKEISAANRLWSRATNRSFGVFPKPSLQQDHSEQRHQGDTCPRHRKRRASRGGSSLTSGVRLLQWDGRTTAGCRWTCGSEWYGCGRINDKA
ncbi:hypothetical protein KCV06_g567, partial [Aureobasidium melanogenum]